MGAGAVNRAAWVPAHEPEPSASADDAIMERVRLALELTGDRYDATLDALRSDLEHLARRVAELERGDDLDNASWSVKA
jgi:hypothetical protein